MGMEVDIVEYMLEPTFEYIEASINEYKLTDSDLQKQIRKDMLSRKYFRNWLGNINKPYKSLFQPNNDSEINSIIKTALKNKNKIRVVGANHSFNEIAYSKDIII